MTRINIYYQNVRGLRSKTNNFRLGLLDSDYDIVALTETWLNSSINNSELFSNEYVVFRRDRDANLTGMERGGGVIVGIKRCFVAKRLFELETESENMWIKLKLSNNYSVILSIVYFSPSSNFETYKNFFEKLDLYNFRNERLLLLGDFNLPITGVQCDLKKENNICKQLLFFMRMHSLASVNNVINFKGRTLDLVLTDINDLEVSEESLPMVNIDRYHPALNIYFKINGCMSALEKLVDEVRPNYNFSKADFNLLYSSLRESNWNDLYCIQNTDEAVKFFYDKMYDIFNLSVPKKRHFNSKYPNWYSKNLKVLIKRKEKIRRKYKKYNMPHLWDEYRSIRREIKQLIRIDYKEFLKTAENEINTNPKSFWKVINNLRGNNVKPATMELDNEEVEGGAAIAEAFANYFNSVYNPCPFNSYQLCQQAIDSPVMTNVDTLSFNLITKQEVFIGVNKLKPKRTVGPDGIPPYIFKACAEILVLPLQHLFNLSLINNYFPNYWKLAKIVPVPKKGISNDIKNHRPIAILSTPAKVFESIIYNRLFSHIKKYISDYQHGFFPKRSITSNLINFSQSCSVNIDSNKQVDVIYTDFEKAFDKVDHLTLLAKLNFYGLNDSLIHFFCSYLHERRQYVSYEGYISEEQIVGSGVPQGSNLGPLLFIIFINDIQHYVKHSEMLLYADDLKLFKTIERLDDCHKLQQDIDSLIIWSSKHLKFNTNKCSVVSFTRKTPQFQITFDYEMNNEKLLRKSSIKDLGITFDSKFTFNDHIVSVCKSSYSLLGFIKRSSLFFENINSLKLLFFTLVRSKLEYGSLIWYPHVNYLSEMIECVQKRFVKFIYYKSFGFFTNLIPYSELLDIFELPSMTKRYKLNTLIFLYKLLKGQIDDSALVSQINFAVPRPGSRSIYMFTPNYSRTNLGYNSPFNNMCRFYNCYCREVDIFQDSISIFKTKLLNTINNV